MSVVPEYAEAGTSITTESAHDSDSGRFGQVSYSLLGDAARAFFSVDQHTGEVTFVASFDRELQDEYHARVPEQVSRMWTRG